MTTREVVNELRKRGHKIKYRVRSDGGILITSMDGVKYTGAAGNKIARTLVGDEAALSQTRKTQLKIIKPAKGPKPKEDVLQGRIQTRIKQVQKAYNKNKVPISQGRITKRLIRKIVQEEGMEAAYRKLAQSERYAEGFAISKVVEALADYVDMTASLMEDNEELYKLVKGLMIESYIEDGCQPSDGTVYGKSITDPCLGWEKTKDLILELAKLRKNK